MDSVILSAAQKLFFLELTGFNNKSFSLLWRGSRDGFDKEDFHRLCDGKVNTVTVIKNTNGFIFGGFTSIPWSSSGASIADSSSVDDDYQVDSTSDDDDSQADSSSDDDDSQADSSSDDDQSDSTSDDDDNQADSSPNDIFKTVRTAFLFSLTNPSNTPLKLKVKLSKYAVAVQSDGGPTFGTFGHDLRVSSLSNTNRDSHMNLFSYEFPKGKSGTEGGRFIVGGPDHFFQTDEIEVFQVL